jgi:hypothetical protein
MYFVYHMNVPMDQVFRNRDAAVAWIMKQTMRPDHDYHYEDFEILDGSDFL